MQRVIVTGPNGAGKSWLAATLVSLRPDVPLISFDAMKLRTGWAQRPRAEIDTALAAAITGDAWVLEGGPSLLRQAVERADALVWLDPPGYVRAWRLARRPWQHFGKTRPGLPAGNVDWPLQQYRFALRSLRKSAQFRAHVENVFEDTTGLRKWRCRKEADVAELIRAWVAFVRPQH